MGNSMSYGKSKNNFVYTLINSKTYELTVCYKQSINDKTCIFW